jgi:hypothetical protein
VAARQGAFSEDQRGQRPHRSLARATRGPLLARQQLTASVPGIGPERRDQGSQRHDRTARITFAAQSVSAED